MNAECTCPNWAIAAGYKASRRRVLPVCPIFKAILIFFRIVAMSPYDTVTWSNERVRMSYGIVWMVSLSTFYKNSRVYDLWAKTAYVKTWQLVSKQYDIWTWGKRKLVSFLYNKPILVSAQTSVALKRYSSGSQQKWQALIKTIYNISHR